jgi:hypothetical protein
VGHQRIILVVAAVAPLQVMAEWVVVAEKELRWFPQQHSERKIQPKAAMWIHRLSR